MAVGDAARLRLFELGEKEHDLLVLGMRQLFPVALPGVPSPAGEQAPQDQTMEAVDR